MTVIQMTCCPVPHPEVASVSRSGNVVTYELYCDECSQRHAEIRIPGK